MRRNDYQDWLNVFKPYLNEMINIIITYHVDYHKFEVNSDEFYRWVYNNSTKFDFRNEYIYRVPERKEVYHRYRGKNPNEHGNYLNDILEYINTRSLPILDGPVLFQLNFPPVPQYEMEKYDYPGMDDDTNDNSHVDTYIGYHD